MPSYYMWWCVLTPKLQQCVCVRQAAHYGDTCNMLLDLGRGGELVWNCFFLCFDLFFSPTSHFIFFSLSPRCATYLKTHFETLRWNFSIVLSSTKLVSLNFKNNGDIIIKFSTNLPYFMLHGIASWQILKVATLSCSNLETMLLISECDFNFFRVMEGTTVHI